MPSCVGEVSAKISPLRTDYTDKPLLDQIICLLDQFAPILDRIMCMFDQFISKVTNQHLFICVSPCSPSALWGCTRELNPSSGCRHPELPTLSRGLLFGTWGVVGSGGCGLRISHLSASFSYLWPHRKLTLRFSGEHWCIWRNTSQKIQSCTMLTFFTNQVYLLHKPDYLLNKPV